MAAPCESCPCDCTQCAWDHSAAIPANRAVLRTIRTPTEYGCVRKDAAIVVDDNRTPFMQTGGQLLPLSRIHGHVIVGTQLERDIAA